MQSDPWVTRMLEHTIALPSSSALSNFYIPDSDRDFFVGTTANQRVAQLREHLQAAEGGAFVVLGEAAGWRGARQSGVAFTSAPDLGLPGSVELSARVVRRTLQEVGLLDRVLLWNALPLHPHMPGAPASNRTPKRNEVALGAECLRLAVEGRRVVCVGRTAAAALWSTLGIRCAAADAADGGNEAVVVRHPSFGGAAQFRAQLRSWAGTVSG